MLVVIEGPEQAGKTTLAEQLILNRSRKCSFRYFRHGPGDSNHQRIMSDLEYCLARPYDLNIMDRWWPSELVYRPFDKKPSTLPLEIRTLEARYGGLADACGIRLMVLAPVKTLERRREENPLQDDIPIPPAEERAAYEEIIHTGNWYPVTQGYTRTIQDVVDAKWAKVIKDFQDYPTHPPLPYAAERQRQWNYWESLPQIWKEQ